MAGGARGEDVGALGGDGEDVRAVVTGERRPRLRPRRSINVTLARGTGVPAESRTRPRKPRSTSSARSIPASSSLLARSCGARLGFGRNRAISSPTATAPVAIRKESRNPCMVGIATPPTLFAVFASTMPITALDTDVPMERISVLSPFAAPVSEAGTAPTISAGREE